MKAEIIAVGTEILLGQIVDTNSPFVAQQLVSLDINTYYQTVVGDNKSRLLAALKIASQRADLIITIGGLGPTKDDLTKETIADFLNKDLVTDDMALQKITNYFKQTNRKMTKNNSLQALFIDGAKSLNNEIGLAVGSFYKNPNGVDVLMLPGPPLELKQMFLKYAMPLLNENYVNDGVLFSRILRFYGIGESSLVTKLDDLITRQTNPTLAPYAKENEVVLRITAHADSKDEVIKLIDDMEEKVFDQVGKYFYGYDEEYSLTQCVGELLIRSGLTICAAESLTAGLFQSELGKIEGISKVLKGGFVTYTPEVKSKLVNVDSSVIKQKGVVSQEVAIQMALGAKEILDTDVAISFTGVASGVLENKQAGTVWIAIAFKNQKPKAYLYHFGNDRNQNRYRAVMAGLDIIRRTIIGLPMLEK